MFRDMLNRFVMVYLDDILIHSRTYPEHIVHVGKVLRHLRGYGLYAKADKCKFQKEVLSFLGYRTGPPEELRWRMIRWQR